MRIDYSEPKKSCSSGSSKSSHGRPRQVSSGGTLAVVCVTGLLCFGIGFGGGWMASQRSAKKAFREALEQQSLENSPLKAKTPIATQQQLPAAPAAAQQQPQAGGAPPQPAPAGGQPAADPPLSFYKTLPSGQKSNVMGSGINAKEEKPAKQPLQAAMPPNALKPVVPQNDDHGQKTPVQAAAVRQDASGYTVQVASYSLKSEAETTRSKLAAKGYNVSIVESRLGDKGTWFRVRIGKRLDADAAKELAGKLGKGAIAIPDKD